MKTYTKIVCTMGPAVGSYDKIVQLIQAGMHVARLNFSHGSHEEHLVFIDMLKKARQELQVPLPIMLDTKGPEVRVAPFPQKIFHFEPGDRAYIVHELTHSSRTEIPITPHTVIPHLPKDTIILFNDGYLKAYVIENYEDHLLIEFIEGGPLEQKKGVNVPNASLHLPAVTQKDQDDIAFGIAQGIDLIAASFIRSAHHIFEIKQFLASLDASDTPIIAKIENHEGIENFDTILQAADGIMVARGDLGVEIPLSKVPRYQKMMIRKCYLAGKPVTTATQMLESMIHSPRPTRAEASDVANAIYDSTSSVMLSGETAVGQHPIKVVQVMKNIVQEAEEDFDDLSFFNHHSHMNYYDVSSCITLAAVKTAHSSRAKAIFTFTQSGKTARLLSRLRPKIPIIAITKNPRTFHKLGLNWGIFPLLTQAKTFDEAFAHASKVALAHKFATHGDLVLVTYGSHYDEPSPTNMLMLKSLGNVIVRGETGHGSTVSGMIAFLDTTAPPPAEQKILVLPNCSPELTPWIQSAQGVILQNTPEDHLSESIAISLCQKFSKPLLIRADQAMETLQEQQYVTLDPQKGVVYHEPHITHI